MSEDRNPLELVIYPYVDRWVEVPVATHWGTSITRSREMGYERPDGIYDFTMFGPDLFDKRLTDAELAAESYRAAAWIGANGRAYATDEGRNIVFEAAFTFGPETRDEHEWLVMHRFATHPHYDEEQA